MSLRLRDALMRELGTLRYEPTEKRIRGMLGDATVIDSTRARLVWEPKRVVPTYAFPVQDVDAQIAAAPPPAEEVDPDTVGVPAGVPLGEMMVLDPSIPFAVRTTPGEPVVLRARDGVTEVAGFLPDDDGLDGYVIVDFADFDAWYEEDERNLGHPRDPFHRIDIVHSTRHVRIEHEGEVLAESTTPYLLFEPPLPVRYYLPPEDVRADLLMPSDKRTFCAYKGEAWYLSRGDDGDIAWFYPEPLREGGEITDRVAFFNERVDIVVDGARLERPRTPWSPR
ncbi:MAG: hypothetical protein QOH08_918 [Chloroflexota bacterium]|nr:hypothetical protein [Chloroflexota bacterium]